MALSVALQAAPILIPAPKFFQEMERSFIIDKVPIYIPDNNRQCQIASEDVYLRIKELGGAPGTISTKIDCEAPGIFILTAKDDAAAKLSKKYAIKVSEANPGPQGYVIHTGINQLVIIGSDDIGALYGAMTLRQMLEFNGNVHIKSALIRDWPDFAQRTAIPMHRGLERLAGKVDKTTLVKKQLDWMMRFKMNVTKDYPEYDPRKWGDSVRSFYRDIHDYAVERGIFPMLILHSNVYGWHTSVNTAILPTNVKSPKDWKCVSDSRSFYEFYYCWSDDEATRSKAKAVAELLEECNFKILYLHPVDSGSLQDPEKWSKRCPECRKRWKDDERWKATLHQIGIWENALKKVQLDNCVFCCVLYPYSVSYLDILTKQNQELWRQNVHDYWKYVFQRLDPSIMAYTWMGKRGAIDRFRSLYCKGRPLQISDRYPDDLGVFSTISRFYVTSLGDRRDAMTISGRNALSFKWLFFMNAAEFSWNAFSPGCEEWTGDGLFYDCERDHTYPAAIMEGWLPSACQLFWGKEMAADMVNFYSSGVLPRYILNPSAVITSQNRHRKDPLADTDPSSKRQIAKTSLGFKLVDDAERMRKQVVNTEICVKALENSFDLAMKRPILKRRLFARLYRRAFYWLTIAKARYDARRGDELIKKGELAEASKIYQEALVAYMTNMEMANASMKKVNMIYDPKFGNDPSRFAELKVAKEMESWLERKLSSASIILKRRRPGRFVKVGVFKGNGSEATLKFLKNFKNVKAEIIDNLSLETLDKFDCVFMLKPDSVNHFDYFNNLRRYVIDGGGGVLFEHSLCGNKRFATKTPFPEVCENAENRLENFDKKIFTVGGASIMAGVKPGTEYENMYVDFFEPSKGEAGYVIAVNKDDRPVALAGKIGFGKVVFNGCVSVASLNNSYNIDSSNKSLFGFNAMLAVKAIEWFTGAKLEKDNE